MPKKVKFPIHITEVYQGIESDKTLDIGEIVQCLGCGQDIEINGETVSIGADDLPYVTCPDPNCRRKIFAPYYIEQREKKVRWKGKDVYVAERKGKRNMIRCLLEECKHNDDGFCDESGYFSPTLNYLDGGVLPVCEDYELRVPDEEES